MSQRAEHFRKAEQLATLAEEFLHHPEEGWLSSDMGRDLAILAQVHATLAGVSDAIALLARHQQEKLAQDEAMKLVEDEKLKALPVESTLEEYDERT